MFRLRPSCRRVTALLFLLSLCALTVGCGTSYYQYSGTVKFDGKPIPVGKIYFNPDGSKGNTGPSGYADIKDGQYTTNVKGSRGVIGGPMIVKIEGADGVKIDDERPNGKPLFPYYEVPVDMPKSNGTKDFDVPASATKAKPSGTRPPKSTDP